MQLKSILAAAGFLVAFAAFLATPALAQQPVAGSPAITPVCANCHENQHLSDHADRPRRQERRQRQHVPGVPRRRLRAPAGSDEEQDGQRRSGRASRRRRRTRCAMTCHAGNRHLVFWESGKHAKNEVSCSNCHSIHGKPGQRGRERRSRRRSARTNPTCAAPATSRSARRRSSPRTTRSGGQDQVLGLPQRRTARSRRRC